MRNNVKCKKWLILAAICVLSVLFACTEQIVNGVPEAEDLTLTIAKQWYESEYPPIVTTRTTGGPEDEVLMKPDWRGAIASAKGRFETVETPILTDRGHIMMDAETAEHWNPLMRPNFIRNTNRIVVLRDKETNKTRSFIMMFIGSYDYLKRGGKMEQNSYLFREPDYDGLVYYYSINGEFINGWRYSNGKIVGYFSSSCDEQNKEAPTTRAMQQLCHDVCVTEYRTECHDEYVLVSGDMESGYVYDIFTQCYNVPMYNCHQECQWFDDGRPTDPNTPYPPGGVGEDPNKPGGGITTTTPNADKLYGSESTLTKEQKALLEKAIVDLKKNPIFKNVLETLEKGKVKIKFEINPDTKGNAEFKANVIGFSNQNCIDDRSLREEFVHALQYNSIYKPDQMNVTNKFNIELEAHIFVDAAIALNNNYFYKGDSNTIGLGGTEALRDAVTTLMNSILDYGGFTSNQLPLYKEVAKNWNQYPGSYIETFPPEALGQYIKK